MASSSDLKVWFSSLPGCLSKDATGTSANPHSHPFLSTCFYTGFLSLDVTGSLFPFSILNLSSHSVSVQRRDRSLFSFLHLYQVPFLFRFSVSLSHSVSVQRRDRSLSFYFTSLPRPLFLPVSFVFSWLFCLPPGSLFALSFRSVSVQRRGRYSVSPF